MTPMDLYAIREALSAGIAIDDADFDRLFPDSVRRMSVVHWTPVSVALRAAALLAPAHGMRVLDLGSGPGKLCCIAALAGGGAWHGIEASPALVAAATVLARDLAIADRTSFAAGDLFELDWDRYDAIYLYHPFEAALFSGPPDRAAAFAGQVARAEHQLARLSPGRRVVTFYGFGGAMPPWFARAATEIIAGGELVLWAVQPRP
jgi:SAM-dependent methyltransferase